MLWARCRTCFGSGTRLLYHGATTAEPRTQATTCMTTISSRRSGRRTASAAKGWSLPLIPRPYQEEAYERIVDRGNQLLAIVMGGGKTAVALAAIETLHARGDV